MASDNPLARHGGLTYLQIATRDGQRSAQFYQRVFDWRIDQRSPNDWRFSDGAHSLIGRFVDGAPTGEAAFVPFIYVIDVDTAIERVMVYGGKVVSMPRSEGDVCVAEVQDPSGNRLGLWQFASR